MTVNDRTKAITQHFLEKSFKQSYQIKKCKRIIWKTQKCFFLNVCCVLVFCLFLYCSVCWFLYGPFCHGTLRIDISTLFTTFFLWKFLQFIIYYYSIRTICICFEHLITIFQSELTRYFLIILSCNVDLKSP